MTCHVEERFIEKLFTEIINHVRSKVIFSYAYMQSDFLLKPVELTIKWHLSSSTL